LFAARAWVKGDTICEYKGTPVPSRIAATKARLHLQQPRGIEDIAEGGISPYQMRLDRQVPNKSTSFAFHTVLNTHFLMSQVHIDAQYQFGVLARYINDPRNAARCNVKFVKQPAAFKADVQAIRDIAVGEELYVNYGAAYWKPITGGTSLQ
jgi:hypothetical protein